MNNVILVIYQLNLKLVILTFLNYFKWCKEIIFLNETKYLDYFTQDTLNPIFSCDLDTNLNMHYFFTPEFLLIKDSPISAQLKI